MTRAASIGDVLWKPDEARVAIGRALALDPSFAPAFELDGRILISQRRYAEAIWCLRQALTIAPNADDARLTLASVFERVARPQDAARALEALLERNPAHAEARRRLEGLTGGGPPPDQGSAGGSAGG